MSSAAAVIVQIRAITRFAILSSSGLGVDEMSDIIDQLAHARRAVQAERDRRCGWPVHPLDEPDEEDFEFGERRLTALPAPLRPKLPR